VTSLLFSSDGNTLFIGTEKQKILVYNIGLRNHWYRYQILSFGSRLSRITSSRGDTVDHLFRSHDDSDLLTICSNKMIHWKLDPSDNEFKIVHQHEWSEYLGTLSLSSDNSYLISAYEGDYGFLISTTVPSTSGNLFYSLKYHSTFKGVDMAGQGGITCIEFGSGGNFALGFEKGYVGLSEIISSTGSVQYRGGFEIPGKVLSLAWISDKRLLVGTENGVFIGNSEGTVHRMDKQRLEADRECGLVMIDETMGVYGTSTGHFHTCKVKGDRVIPVTGRPPVASSFPPDTFSSRREKTARFAFGGVGTVTVLTGTYQF
jgi:WD40 repeat protein